MQTVLKMLLSFPHQGEKVQNKSINENLKNKMRKKSKCAWILNFSF